MSVAKQRATWMKNQAEIADPNQLPSEALGPALVEAAADWAVLGHTIAHLCESASMYDSTPGMMNAG